MAEPGLEGKEARLDGALSDLGLWKVWQRVEQDDL